MYHVVFAYIIHAQRERELEEAARLRRLLRQQDDAVEPTVAPERRDGRLTPRPRLTSGW